jgi:hypothetical protein
VFSASLPASRNLFWASGIFCSGRYQPGCTRIFWPAKDTSQPVNISKKWQNPSSPLLRKRTWVQALPWFSTYYLGLPASGTDLKWWNGLYSGPSPIQTTTLNLGIDQKEKIKTTTNILPQQTINLQWSQLDWGAGFKTVTLSLDIEETSREDLV